MHVPVEQLSVVQTLLSSHTSTLQQIVPTQCPEAQSPSWLARHVPPFATLGTHFDCPLQYADEVHAEFPLHIVGQAVPSHVT